ncbi:hypothetical protein CLU79DRAFT_756288 [Phycomyces nitens]|nr:hypothetical protein CLU79DRAFT_756288 [Phycomyces nitens]
MLQQLLLAILLCSYSVPILAYKTLIDVLSDEGQFTTLIQHLQYRRLVPYINDIKAGTLFAPNDEAFGSYIPGALTKDELLYHLLPTPMKGDEFFDGQLLGSLYIRPGFLGPANASQLIKITKEGFTGMGRGRVLVNEAPIVKKDIWVNKNTTIQALGKVLRPPHMLKKQLEDKPSLFELLKHLGIDAILNEARPYTVFVSRMDVLGKFNGIEKRYILSDYGQHDLSGLLRYMVVEGALFADTFPVGESSYKTLSGEYITVHKSEENQLTVDGIRVAAKDVLAANGVIHEVQDTVVPRSIVFNSRKYLYGLNATSFVELMDQYGQAHYIDSPGNYTFLVPSNEDLEDDMIPETVKPSWLRYHILGGTWTKDDFQNSTLVASEFRSEYLGGARQRIPVYVETEGIQDVSSRPTGRSVRFGRSRILGEIVGFQGSMFYQISEPLSLPDDLLNKLVVDLELSTFIATLYVSKVARDMSETHGITLFVPTNKAFESLGLVAKYLMHPSAKPELQSVLRYHAVQQLLYSSILMEGVHEVETLGNVTLRIAPTDGQLIVSQPNGSGAATVGVSDLLVSNGVVHKIDQVQIPTTVSITNRQLLVGIEATTMLELLNKANLLAEIEKTDCIVLAPSNKAFAQIDLETLINDPYELDRVVRLHLIPKAWQDTWLQNTYRDEGEYPTLLSEWDKLLISNIGQGELVVGVKGQPEKVHAQVTGMGKASTGGGVMEIDTVLSPVRRGLFGLPWLWSVALVAGVISVTALILALCGFFIYKIWSRRRLGYRAI